MKKWLQERFLPMWAKQTVFRENRDLQRENQVLKARLRELECYIRGMHRMCRTGYGKEKAEKRIPRRGAPRNDIRNLACHPEE